MPRAPLRLILRAVFLIFAALHSWHWRFTLDADGISYSDIARAWMRGDWANALNSYWSPLYSWLLAIFWSILRPGIAWELPVVHLINFCGVVLALFAWEWLLREWERCQGPAAHPVVMDIAGYGVLFWAVLHTQVDVFTSADVFVIPILLAIAALLLRKSGVWLGVLLGVGFLAKAAFLPAILLVLFAVWRRRLPLLRTAAAALCTILPFVVALSIAKGRLVLNDAGRINYSWQVSGFGLEGYKESAWPAPPDIPHPVRVAFDDPRVLSYDQHMVGTVPSHADPAWWSAGFPVRLDLSRQLMIFGKSLAWFALRFLHCPALFPLFLALVAGHLVESAGRFARLWFLWLPAAGLSFAYCLVFVLDRYFAAPWALIGFCLLAAVWPLRLPASLSTPAVVLVLAGTLISLRAQARIVTSAFSATTPDAGTPVIAAWLRDHGFKQGDWVAVIGVPLDTPWLGLIGGQVVATVPARIFHDDRQLGRDLVVTLREPLRYWRAGPERQAAVAELVRGLGAKWLIGWPVPAWADTAGWQNAGEVLHDLGPAFRPGVYVRRLGE